MQLSEFAGDQQFDGLPEGRHRRRLGLAGRLDAAGYPAILDGDTLLVRDPSGNLLRFNT